MSDTEKIKKIREAFFQCDLTFDEPLPKEIMLMMSVNTIYEILDDMQTLIMHIRRAVDL